MEGHQKMKLFVVTLVIKSKFLLCFPKHILLILLTYSIVLLQADCVGNGKELCDRFGVQMYPMIKLFRHGVFQQDFDGERKAGKIIHD